MICGGGRGGSSYGDQAQTTSALLTEVMVQVLGSFENFRAISVEDCAVACILL